MASRYALGLESRIDGRKCFAARDPIKSGPQWTPSLWAAHTWDSVGSILEWLGSIPQPYASGKQKKINGANVAEVINPRDWLDDWKLFAVPVITTAGTPVELEIGEVVRG